MKNKIFAAIVCTVIFFTQSVFADNLEVSYDAEKELININGSFNDVSQSGLYSIIVSKKSDDSNVYTSFGYAHGNSFYDSIMLPADCEEDYYYVSVNPYLGNKIDNKDKSIFICSLAKKDAILKDNFSNQSDATVLAQKFNSYLKYFGLGENDYDYFLLSQNQRIKVASRLLSKSFSYDKYSEFLNELNMSVAIEMLENATKDNVISTFDKYEKYFNLNNEICYPIYSGDDKNISNQLAVKKYAIELFAHENISDLTTLKKYFNENLILAAISNVISYGEINSIIDKYESAIDFSLSLYNSSNKTDTAYYISSLKRNYTLMSTLEEDIKNACEKQNVPSKGKGSSSSGGSSSSFYAPSSGENVSNEQIFNDVPSTHWAYEIVKVMKNKKIVLGDSNGNFNPDSFITRDEFAKLIVCAFDFYDESANCDFYDVKDDWSYKYVSSLYNKKITQGISKTMFGKGIYITREDMAVICANAAQISDDVTGTTFADSESISDYAISKVNALCKIGAIKGFDDNTFRPKLNATRAEAAAVIYSIIK